ncbi:MAG: type II toxin-antitoxin system Phd/YefM family antitoxin [bacterium]|nr:type II toxin-antitoxin system Phd/YefM family antitoxin [bacterium]
MATSLTKLRTNIFKFVDQVIDTGIPLEIERKGHRLKIVLEEKKSKLSNLKPHKCIIGDPDELVEVKVAEWKELENL